LGFFIWIFPEKGDKKSEWGTKKVSMKEKKRSYGRFYRSLHIESEARRNSEWQRENVSRVHANRHESAARRLKEIGLGATQ
jgi:hypothetical protein